MKPKRLWSGKDIKVDDKTILIGGMADRIVEQIRHGSELKQQNLLLSSGSSGSADAEHKARIAAAAANQAHQKVVELQTALDQKDALLKEWMHSNEAFKRLARKYGKKLGLSDEQRTQDFREEVLAVVEEDPNLDSNLTGKVKEALGKKL